MIIGIDARPLSETRPTGITKYLKETLTNYVDKDNKYILYSNKPICEKLHFKFDYSVKIIKQRSGTYFIYWYLYNVLKKDCVDVFWGTEHILPKRKKGIRMVLTIHDLALLHNYRWGKIRNVIVQNIFTRKSINNADSIIAISESTKNDIINVLKIDKSKINTIYLGFSKVKEKTLFEDSLIKNKYFLFVGSMDKRKNILNIVKSFIEFKKRNHDSSYKLVIAGSGGNEQSKVMGLINKSMYKDDIIITGYVDDNQISNLYYYSSFILYPSLYEGFGLPILEGYSYNKIVLISNNSSLREIGGEDAPFVNDANDYFEICDKIEQIIAFSNDKQNNIINKNKEQLLKFSWKKSALLTREVVINGKRK